MMLYEKQEAVLDEKKLNRIKLRILNEEKENQKTHTQTEGQMVDKLRKIIEEEVRKCY